MPSPSSPPPPSHPPPPPNPRNRQPSTPRPIHPATLSDDTLLAQCDLTKGRSSGPGGQHRNKVETLVELRHLPTGLEAHAGERRSATENKRVAVWRLRLVLAIDVRTRVPMGEIRSALWLERTRGGGGGAGRIACNPEHRDYPSLLAEAMDVLFACGGDAKTAGLRLGVSPTQLVKLLREHPPALTRLNEWRRERGEHPLK